MDGENYEEVAAVSSGFDEYLQEEVYGLLLPETQEIFDFRGVRLVSETACAVEYYEITTGEGGWTSPSLLYEWDETEFMIFDSTRQFSISLTYEANEQRLELCDWAFAYTWQTERGTQDFNGPDFPTCQRLNEVDESDPVRAYIVDNDFLRFDTLCVIPLTRHYYQE